MRRFFFFFLFLIFIKQVLINRTRYRHSKMQIMRRRKEYEHTSSHSTLSLTYHQTSLYRDFVIKMIYSYFSVIIHSMFSGKDAKSLSINSADQHKLTDTGQRRRKEDRNCKMHKKTWRDEKKNNKQRTKMNKSLCPYYKNFFIVFAQAVHSATWYPNKKNIAANTNIAKRTIKRTKN